MICSKGKRARFFPRGGRGVFIPRRQRCESPKGVKQCRDPKGVRELCVSRDRQRCGSKGRALRREHLLNDVNRRDGPMNDLGDVVLSLPSAKIAKESVVQAIARKRWMKGANWKAELKSTVHSQLLQNVDLYK
jgi:hypothetical protein